ncbi:MAG: SusE domain-containing protein [Flavobacteriaceae bacterium]
MKKLFKNTILLFSILLVLGACDTKPILTLVPSANTTLSISDNTVVLIEADAGNEAFTLTWSDPNFGFDAAASYTILIDLHGGDFSNPQTIAMGADLSKAFTGQELNSKALALGIKPNVPTKIDFKVQTTLSGAQQMMSGAVTVTVTAFSSLLDLSTNWGVVGSATPGGWGNPDIPDLPFYTTSEAGVYIAYVTLRDGEIKFRLDNLWTTNYGDDGADGSLEQNGANIAVTAGTYKIMVNTNDFSWTMEAFSWGLVGSATPNGWGAPDFKLHYNSYQDNWKAVVTFTTGEFKFRFNEDWGVNLGDNGADGVADAGGDNIAVTEGHYLVTLDLNTNEYTVEQIDVWGLVGSATPNGWNGPDTKFTPDFGNNEGVFYITGITLVDGEIKIRQNDAWGINYGDDGNDGTVELNGANIPVTAGTYNITFDSVAGTIVMHKW